MPSPQLAAPRLVPAAPQQGVPPGTEASRRLLGPEPPARPLTLWGSSSMSSEGGDQATPVAIRVHEHLALAAAPAPVHALGVGATTTSHTLLMRGLETPEVLPEGTPSPADGAVPVRLSSGLAPAGPLRIPGAVGGTAGTLDGSDGTWVFRPDDPVDRLAPGPFRSALAEVAEGSRQVLWMGKNNIRAVDQVIDHTQRMCDAAADPERDNLVLGHWPTPFDPVGSETAVALEAVNTELAARCGERFVDLAALLTTEEGLSCPPLMPLRLLEQAATHDALAQGVVPDALRSPDGIHLNGWGNLAVCWSMIRRMRELRWL